MDPFAALHESLEKKLRSQDPFAGSCGRRSLSFKRTSVTVICVTSSKAHRRERSCRGSQS